MTPTARSLKYLRNQGYKVQVVEQWIPRARVRRDLFGFIDLVGMRDSETGLLGVQVTTQPNVSNRLKKIRELKDNVSIWLRTGNRFAIHAWAKKGAHARRKLWQIQEVEITEESLR